jgi:hypothetical protein
MVNFKRGFLQEEGIHLCGNYTDASVTNETTIKIVFVLLTLAEFDGHVIDVKGAFLKSSSRMKKRYTCKFYKDLKHFIILGAF